LKIRRLIESGDAQAFEVRVDFQFLFVAFDIDQVVLADDATSDILRLLPSLHHVA